MPFQIERNMYSPHRLALSVVALLFSLASKLAAAVPLDLLDHRAVRVNLDLDLASWQPSYCFFLIE